jgi:type III secretion protein C
MSELTLTLSRACIGALLLFASVAGQAADLQWRRERVNLVYQEKALPDLLRELFASAGRPAVISEKIKATVTGRFNSPAEDFFNSVCSVFGLLSYYDGAVLYIYSGSEAVSRILPLKHVSPQRLQQSLRELDALDRRYLLKINEVDRIVQVAGPPRYVEVVADVISLLDERAGNSRSDAANYDASKPIGSVFKVFGLRYAWAQDTAMTVGGREIVIAGVASMLRRLSGNYPASPTAGAVAPPMTASSQHSLPKLRGSGLAAQDGQSMRRSPSATDSVPIRGDAQPPYSHSALVNITLPRIESDARTNSVVIHDLPERIDRYEALIAALDVKTVLVQIEASIVDVASDSIDRLGIDWSQSRNQIVLGQGNGSDSIGFRQQAGNLAAQAAGASLSGVAGATTIVSNLGRYFLANVNLLAQEGKAHIHARPSVLTVSNTEAILENTQTFYVRLAGEREVDLFNITSGTSLRVTPALVEEGGERKIKLSIRIEDGSLTGQSVDQIPVVQRSTVGTQAMVGEGQSLLIGGAAYSVDRETQSKVPLLGDVPALGALFKFHSRQVSRVERLFMITPRIINL